MTPKCEKCSTQMVDLECSHSSYETFTCPNRDCDQHGKAQLHRRKA